ncbi:MAG: tape measure protein [Bacteroidetes bacterium]|nr:MAG: tape measure protein [Bacteroidota bacterium]
MKKSLEYVINMRPGDMRGVDMGKAKVMGLDRAVKTLGNDFAKSTQTLATQIDRSMGQLTTRLDRHMRIMGHKYNKALGVMGNNGGGGGKSGGGGLFEMGALSRFLAPAAIIGAGKMAIDFSDQATEVKMQVQSLDNAIKFANAKEGEKNLLYLDQTANKLGNDLMAAKEGFALLSAGALGTKITNVQVKDMYESVAGALTVMGRSAEDQKGTFLALSQIMGKGKVQAEELRGQIGERIPGAFNIAARAMGVTNAQLDKMMADGKLMAEDFLPKFAAELKRTFASGLPTAMQSTRAEMTRIENQTVKTMAVLGDQLEGVSLGWKQVKLAAMQALSEYLPKQDVAKPLYAVNAELNKNFETLQSLIPGTEEYNALREKINSTYPQYLQNLITEKDTLWDLKYAQEQANEVMKARRVGMIGKERIKELEEEKRATLHLMAYSERKILDVEARRRMGDKAGLFEANFNDQISQHLKLIDGAKNALTEIDNKITRERDITFKVSFEGNRRGLLNDAKSIQELAMAMYGQNAGDYSKASPQAIAGLVTAANRKFGSQVQFSSFGLKQDKKGNWVFGSDDATGVAGGGSGSPYSPTVSAGRSVRNVSVQIENLIREFTVNTSSTNEAIPDMKRGVTDSLTRAVTDFESAL